MGRFKECVDCGNKLSPTAKECGNPSCRSSDPFGKERFQRRLKRLTGVGMIAAAGVFYVYHFGLVSPLDIIKHPLTQQPQ